MKKFRKFLKKHEIMTSFLFIIFLCYLFASVAYLIKLPVDEELSPKLPVVFNIVFLICFIVVYIFSEDQRIDNKFCREISSNMLFLNLLTIPVLYFVGAPGKKYVSDGHDPLFTMDPGKTMKFLLVFLLFAILFALLKYVIFRPSRDKVILKTEKEKEMILRKQRSRSRRK